MPAHNTTPDHATLHDTFAALRDVRGGSLAELIEKLQVALPLHFASEEKPGGLFDCIRMEAPRFAVQADLLKAQHAQLLAQLNHAEESLSTCLAQLTALSELLTTHEAAENRLFVETLSEDLGQGD